MNLELRKAVAEKVMGLEDVVNIGGLLRHSYRESDGSKWTRPVMQYELNIADAWLVVEKMREHGMGFRMYQYKDGRCVASFQSDSSSRGGPNGDAPAAPEAICRAALAAILREIE